MSFLSKVWLFLRMYLSRESGAAQLLLCWFCVAIFIFVVIPCVSSHFAKVPSLLIVSFDGFRWDYLSRTSTPHFDRVIKEGVHVTSGLKNIFTTSTLTNHWSMVTGLYAESHGIIENEMFDPVINKSFVPLYKNRFAVNDQRYFDVPGVEPIWVANQLQREDGRSGSVMWWGGEYAIKYVRPTYHMPYNMFGDPIVKINTMVGWFLNKNPINLGLLYFSEPDHTAHKCGPMSQNVTDRISEADYLLGFLLENLKKADILDDMNIIITSDHGFTSMSRDRLIHLDLFIDPSWYRVIHYNPVASIIPHEGYEDQIYKKLKEAAPENHFRVFKKDEIPERLRYKNSPRVTPIILIADLHWAFISKLPDTSFKLAGGHGYDNENNDMRPFFMAMGPSFKSGYEMDTFNSIDIYALMCHLLHLKPNPNNGTLTKVSQLLLPHGHENTMLTFVSYIICLFVTASVGGVFVVAACRQRRYLKRKLNQLRCSSFSKPSSLIADNGSTVKLLSDEDEDDF